MEKTEWQLLETAPPDTASISAEMEARGAPRSPKDSALYWFKSKGDEIAVCKPAPPLTPEEQKLFEDKCFSELSVYKKTEGKWAHKSEKDVVVLCGAG